jgi:serine/threonine-protein kinase
MTNAIHDQLQAALGATHTIDRELGGGGMSHVFLATERRFGRSVVVKVLPPDVTGSLSAERFEREMQVAARLQHPHIVPLLTAGEGNGLLYYTMPYVQGETLRDRLVREGRLPVADALRIARDVADALACAHRGGVVHRDIKPENIFLSAGHAVVGDFGIAKAISASATRLAGPDAGLTQVGMSLGTPAYMSPEQGAGESEFDGRTDIYSLGCVLYEMLAGRQPFTGATAAAVIAKRFMETPAPLREIDGAIPVELETIVTRAMAREPTDRYATAEIVHAALAAIGSERAPPRDDKPSVAVLPFANLSGSADDEYFSDGMTEEVINALARLPDVRVAARTSSFMFKGQRIDLRAVASQLNVKTILEGSVRRAANKVRISAQLIGAADGLHLWSERYDGDLADVFALQDQIAHAIAGALQQRLGGAANAGSAGTRPAPAPVRERAPVSPAAYDAFLRGRFLFEQHKGLEALASFERAAELDPSFALARAWIAHGNMLSANLAQISPLVAYPRARAAADHALTLQPDLPDARLARGFVAAWFDWERDHAEALARAVLLTAPEMTYAHELLGWTLSIGGRVEDGVASMARAYALDPLSDFMLYNFALDLVLVGKPERALDELRRGLARSPGNALATQLMGFAYFATGRLPEALDVLERTRVLAPPRQLAALRACVLAAMGRGEEARGLVAEVEARAALGAGVAVEIATAYHWLGDDAATYEWLERGFETREVWMTWIHLEPRLRRLHGDARFEALVRRVGIRPSPRTVSVQ